MIDTLPGLDPEPTPIGLPGVTEDDVKRFMVKVHRNDPTKQVKKQHNPHDIMVRSGSYFDLAAPTPDMVNIHDIAWALSMTTRYGGHCTEFYSVAQHCVHVAQWVDKPLKLAALLHDAAEAYVGDVVQPLKTMLPGFKEIENDVLGAIALKFGVPFSQFKHPDIKTADMCMLRTEQLYVTPNPDHIWKGFESYEPYPIEIKPWSQDKAFREFLHAYGQYGTPGVM